MDMKNESQVKLLPVKNDFVFKLLFGNEKNKDILIAFLSAVLKIPREKLKDIKIINTELYREFKEDKKGILDVLVMDQDQQIYIEIQITPTEYMVERNLFYLSKMYTSGIKSGDTYDKLKRCISINILDFDYTKLKEAYSSFHITDDKNRSILTNIWEIYYLELPKLKNINQDQNDVVVQWMEFIASNKKEVIEMLVKKNKDIKRAYDCLQIISQDERARMAYEAREMAIHDENTRLMEARIEGKIEIAKEMLKNKYSVEEVAKITKLPVEKVKELLN